ncbi:GREM2 [Cordylochernes scorpioides]|uniref:GREM2 n=1 Tax=Cordylochernes scorpioides TaxID=51811 RepID=A0ABY6KJA5_9ARAC|nr:GREM2 [Cordylochernes scorpioides]
MEKLLMVWVTEKQLQGDTLTQTIICEKARAIYGDLLKQTPKTSIDEASEESFKASRGWFENFKKRSGIHSVVRHVIVAVYACGVDVEKGPIRQQLWNAPPCDNVESWFGAQSRMIPALYMADINPEEDIHTDKTPQLAGIVIRVYGPI